MNTIYRYELAITDEQEIEMPAGAIPLHCSAGYVGAGPASGLGNDHPMIHLWCLVDTASPSEGRRFRVVGTGAAAGDIEPSNYIGTAIHELRWGRGVWHVFDAADPS